MAYSKVSLICGIVAFLLISNGVSARLLDSLSGFANINLFDDFEEDHSTDAEKSVAENANSAAAQLPSDKSTLSGLAPAPAPANPLSETGKTEGFEKETYSAIGSGEMDNDDYDGDSDPGSDPAFGLNGMEMEDDDGDYQQLP